jgi:hypothetical protein
METKSFHNKLPSVLNRRLGYPPSVDDGPVAFRPMVTHGLVLEEVTRLSAQRGPVAFRPRVTPGLALIYSFLNNIYR